MNREQAREFITEHPADYLKPDKSGKGYMCPICGSGSGKKGTGITSKDNIHFTCWAGCFTNSDIIDIIGIEHNLTEYNDKLTKAAELYGIAIDGSTQPLRTHSERKDKPLRSASQPEQAEPEQDYTTFFIEANKNLDKTDYLQRRGISRATADRFKLGYVEQWRHPKTPRAPATPRLIIPTSPSSYIARDTRAEIPAEQGNYKLPAKSKCGKVHLFNIKALSTATEPIIIVEGELDAISIYEAGGTAIGLGGVSNIKALAERIRENPPEQPIILSLDNDTPGQAAQRELYSLLTADKQQVYELNIQGKYKDANEALQADRELLTASIQRANEITYYSPELVKQIQYEQKNQASSYIENMRAELEAERNLPEISTGFKSLDKLINGGLYPGLYFIGAISSLGKTTLALQIADAVARQGHDTLIISLEMAKRELIAKSLSRLTAEYSERADGLPKTLGLRTIEINSLKKQQGYYDAAGEWQEYTEQKKATIDTTVNTAYSKYSEYGKHIFINEGIGDISPARIAETVAEHKRIYGAAPIVIIDYLQILQGESERDTDKTRTDKNVTALKRLSRDYNIPVIAVSSVNRSSYNEPISMESFKESGGIEFSSDILIGLQYKGWEWQKKEGTDKRETEPERLSRLAELNKKMLEQGSKGEAQQIEVKILKNRNGTKGTVELDFYPAFNYYKERAAEPEKKRGFTI